MKNKIKKNTGNKQKAFALLYTALISSLLLSLALSISLIVRKEMVLSSIARESQKAFYAADSAAECALYWDFRFNKFATTTTVTGPNSGVTCAGVDIADSAQELDDGVPGLGGSNITKYKLEVDRTCALVTVQKSATYPKTLIEARGYNTPCDSKSRIRLERAVRLQY
jgi:hypothetical protein